MPWASIDDGLHANEKFASISLAATGVWTLCLSWTSNQLKDGFVPAGIVRRFCGGEFDRIVGELVDAGLWAQEEGGFRFHDYLEYNLSAEQVMAKRADISEKRSAAGRAGNAKRWASQTDRNDVAKPSQTDRPIPLPLVGESLSPAEASAHEEPPVMGRSAPAVVKATEPPLAPEPPPLELSRTDPGMRHLRDLYRAFRAERFPDQVPDQYPDSELRKALPALRELANDCKATTAQVHKATAAAMRRWADPADGGDPMFVTVKVIAGDWSAFLEDDPPPKASAPASRNGHAGANRPRRETPEEARAAIRRDFDRIAEEAYQ